MVDSEAEVVGTAAAAEVFAAEAVVTAAAEVFAAAAAGTAAAAVAVVAVTEAVGTAATAGTAVDRRMGTGGAKAVVRFRDRSAGLRSYLLLWLSFYVWTCLLSGVILGLAVLVDCDVVVWQPYEWVIIKE